MKKRHSRKSGIARFMRALNAAHTAFWDEFFAEERRCRGEEEYFDEYGYDLDDSEEYWPEETEEICRPKLPPQGLRVEPGRREISAGRSALPPGRWEDGR